MRGLICLFLLLPLSTLAQVIWVGPDCRISWDANAVGELVQGYRVYVESIEPLSIVQQDVGNVTETTCSAIGLTQGVYELYITAYNPVGESPPSVRLPFVLATSVPGSPGGVSAPKGLKIESAEVVQ